MKPFSKTISEQLQSLKAAIYIRVSTHWQVDKDSLNVQRRELIAYCEMVLGIKDYFVFEDAGYSAKNTERPDYQSMMNRLRTGEFSHLLVWKIDRISRNLLDFASMYAELKQLGITFVSKNEQFDTSSAIGEAMLKIILVFAELERQMTAERVTAVMLSRANNGQWNGGRIPFGYDHEKRSSEFTINEEEAAVVRLIWDLYEERQSLLICSDYLNEHGYRTKNGRTWTPTTVRKILTSVFYVGSYRYNVRSLGTGKEIKNTEEDWITFDDHHPAIIDKERFDRMQSIMKRNRRGGVKDGDTYVRKNVHIFGGLLRCGMCGANMTATIDKRRVNGWRPSIYGCSHRRNNSSNCTNKYISDAVIGPFVFNYVANIIRAKGNSSSRTTPDRLERKLLRGEVFSGVYHIEGIDSLAELLLSGSTGLEYKSTATNIERDNAAEEREILAERRKKDENALNRLKSLYLYGDSGMSEKDFIIEQKKIVDDMNSIDSRISEIRCSESSMEQADDFLEKASYFMMVEKLLGEDYIDYEKYVRSLEPSVPRAFIRNIIKSISVVDGSVTSITFSNGMTHNFIYK